MRSIVLLLALALSATASAQSSTTQAREHFRRGTQLYDLGRYLDAAKEYEEAFSISDRPGFLFNIGQAYRLAGKPREAIAAYNGFLRRLPDAPARAETEAHVAELEKRLAAEEEEARKLREPPPPVAVPPPVAPPPTVIEAPNALIVATPLRAEKRPVYKKWWLWTSVVGAAAIIATGVAVGITETRPHETSFQVHTQ